MEPRCAICGEACSDEDYCMGCGTSVCESCDETMPLGPHFVEDHRSRFSTAGYDIVLRIEGGERCG